MTNDKLSAFLADLKQKAENFRGDATIYRMRPSYYMSEGRAAQASAFDPEICEALVRMAQAQEVWTCKEVDVDGPLVRCDRPATHVVLDMYGRPENWRCERHAGVHHEPDDAAIALADLRRLAEERAA